MKNVKVVLKAVALSALAFGSFGSAAQALDVCQKFSSGFDNVGLSLSCDLSSYRAGASGKATSLSGYSHPGTKSVIAELTEEVGFTSARYTAYAYAQGYDGTTPLTLCKTVQDQSVDGQTVAPPYGSNCSAMTRHRLVIGWLARIE